MKKENSEKNFDVVVWEKGESMDFNHCIGQLLPTELHIKPDGTLEDKPSFAFLLQDGDGRKWCAQLSERMLKAGLNKAMEMKGVDASMIVSKMLDMLLPSDGVGTKTEKIRIELHNMLMMLINGTDMSDESKEFWNKILEDG